jgi:hypothetical protein
MSHIRNQTHLELKTNTDLLGWFWGIIRLNTLNKPFLTIKDILKDCEAFQCQSEKCHKHILATEQGLRTHFTSQHRIKDHRDWRPVFKKISIKTKLKDNNIQESQVPTNHTPDQASSSSNPAHLILRANTISPKHGILRPLSTDEAISETLRMREVTDQIPALRTLYIRKRALLLSQVQSGVNLPPLTAKNKKRLKFALKDLFRAEINPILKEMLPVTDDWESWLAFEGIYEDALDKIRNLILFTKGRDPKRLYGTRRINVPLQTAKERTSEAIALHQTTQQELRKIKIFLQKIVETDRQDQEVLQDHRNRVTEVNRRSSEWTMKIVPILNKIPPEKRQ